MDMAVASGFFPGAGGAVEIGNEGFEIRDEDGKPVGLGAQRKQFLFEIQIEGKEPAR